MISLPFTPALAADLLRGALDVERTAHGVLPHRLPARARTQNTDAQVARAEAMSSGVRLVLRTRATVVELTALRTRVAHEGAPPGPDGVYDLLVDGRPAGRRSVTGGNVLLMDLSTGATETRPGPVGTVRFAGLPARDKDVEIWLPHDEITELVSLRADAPVEPRPVGDRTVWLHHGSSISQGSAAAGPTTTWPAVAASLGGVDLVNLGLSGSAVLDPFVARALRDTPADLISVKLGINIVNLDLMRLRAFGPAVHGFLDTIREGHPRTPLLVVSPLLCPMHEDTPGPSAPELGEDGFGFTALGDPAERDTGKLTLTVIREELARVVERRAADDPHLHYLDGLSLYGHADSAELPLPDRLHPDTAAHHRIGERFAAYAFTPGGPLAPRPTGSPPRPAAAPAPSWRSRGGSTGVRPS
ncbi:GDSL-type esterase/lipase family protein [Streptomyces sp. NPDC050703]|uniref:GDSL-type esterase/lipase family protein n=1 Tax=Streptomyces sp. NPDC050703 TaxID=3157218 RepID=UPI00341B62A2